MTVQFYIFSLLNQFIQFFTSNTDQRSFNTALAAVTIKLRRNRIIDLNIKSVKHLLKKTLRCMSLLEKRCNRLDLLYILF